jgi:hypothetical protein
MSNRLLTERKPVPARSNGRFVRVAGLLSGRYDPEESYPEVEIGLGLTVQLAWLTPEMAEDFIAHLSTNQRNTKEIHLQCLVNDVAAGRFQFNGEPIIMDDADRLIDGRHRCISVIQAGKPIPVLIVRGVPSAAYSTIDITAKRTGADALRSAGHDRPDVLAAAAVLLHRHERGMIGRTYAVISPVATEEILAANPGLVDSLDFARPVMKLLHAVGVPVFCHHAFSRISRADADRFFERLASDEDHKKGEPILTLRRRLLAKQFRADELVSMLFKTWNAFRRNRDVRSLNYVAGEQLPSLI